MEPPPSCVAMAVSAQQLAEELEIFGLDCEDSVAEKCECLPLPGPQPRSTLGSEFPVARNPKGALPGFPSPRPDAAASVRGIQLSFEIWDRGTLMGLGRAGFTQTGPWGLVPVWKLLTPLQQSKRFGAI